MKAGNITISITNRCNYLCKHCSFSSGEKGSEECSVSDWLKFAEEARSFGAEKIDISGGEPTLRKDLPEIIEGTKFLGYKTKLLTNGSFLSDSYIERLKASGLDAIAISLDGSNSDEHNRIRLKGEDDFQRTLDSIRRIQQQGYFTKVNTVVFDSNFPDIYNLVKLVQGMGVDEHRICYFTPTGRGLNLFSDNCLDPLKWLSFIRQDLQEFRGEKLYVGVPFLEKDRAIDTTCYISQGTYPLHVLSNGDIYSCTIQTSTGQPLGNMKDFNLKGLKIKESPGCCFDYTVFARKPSDLCQVCPLRKFKAEDLL